MGKYHFEEDDKQFGETVRIGHISKEVKNYKRKNEDEAQTDQTNNVIQDTIPIKKAETEENKKTETSSQSTIEARTASEGKGKLGRFLNNGLNFKKYAVVAGIIGAGIFITVFVVGFTSMQFSVAKPPVQLEQPVSLPVTDKLPIETVALVKNVNTSNELSLYDLKSHTDFFIKTESATKIIGRANEKLLYADIKIGDVIKISIDTEKKRAISIEYSEDCWNKTGVTDITIDNTAKTMTFDGSVYTYSDETIVKYNDKLMNITDLAPIDVITLNGYGKEIWSVMVENYHGYIVVKNKDKIKNGTIQIDDLNPIPLTGADMISVTSGAHKIKISGTNVEPYQSDIYVAVNEKFEIDLLNIQEKTGVVVIKSNITEYQLFVNGKEIEDLSEPLVLNQGEYQLKIVKSGYIDWEQKIVVKDSSMEVMANLVQEIRKLDLSITTNPTACSVYLNGEMIGTTPISHQVEYGDYRITFRKEGYTDLSLPLTVDETTMPLSVTLTENASSQSDFSGQ